MSTAKTPSTECETGLATAVDGNEEALRYRWYMLGLLVLSAGLTGSYWPWSRSQ